MYKANLQTSTEQQIIQNQFIQNKSITQAMQISNNYNRNLSQLNPQYGFSNPSGIPLTAAALTQGQLSMPPAS